MNISSPGAPAAPSGTRPSNGCKAGKMASSPVLREGLEPAPGYQLRRFLGRGGFGEVWDARAPDGRPVALKFLPCGDGLHAARETRSIQLVRNIDHPGLIHVL